MIKPNPHRETNLYFDKAIIGSSVEALTVAFKYGIPIFGNKALKPLPYYYISAGIDLSQIQVENERESFVYLSGKTEYRGIQRIKLWNILMHRLSISGLAPLYGDYELSIDEIALGSDFQNHRNPPKSFKLYAKGKVVNVHVKNRLIIFDYPLSESGAELYMINDTIKLHNVYNLKENLYIPDNCDFGNTMAYETIFYERDKKMHNCCVKSIISAENLEEWKYSAASVRLHTEKTIFWNLDKEIKISIDKREKKPMLTRMCDSLEDIVERDIMDEELYD
tara:strand:- start:181 stop:1017 length:837 start_codon:yes stop_codon:yes gene_type:complete